MRTPVDAAAGEYLQATIGTAYKVHPNCGSHRQEPQAWEYDYPEPIRVRFVVCREHEQVEAPR